jgi:hypothetical protein
MVRAFAVNAKVCSSNPGVNIYFISFQPSVSQRVVACLKKHTHKLPEEVCKKKIQAYA